jgi:hypothetical protein
MSSAVATSSEPSTVIATAISVWCAADPRDSLESCVVTGAV